MKFLVFFLAMGAVIGLSKQSFTPEQKKAFEEKLVSECTKKEGATSVDLAEIAKREMPTTQTGKCMHACFMETLGFVKDNKVIVEKIIEMAELAFEGDATKIQTAREIGEECAGVNDSDRCELAIKMMACGMTATKNRNINFRDLL